MSPTFLGLPIELREHIFSYLVLPKIERIEHGTDSLTGYRFDHIVTIFLLNRQLHEEARGVFRRQNVLIKVETPFPEARSHIGIEHRVPIVLHNDDVSGFKDYHLAVKIGTPDHDWYDDDPTCVLLLLKDLPAFTQMWFYSDLSTPDLNSHLSLNLKLNNPSTLSFEEKPIPKRLQEQLLLPFGSVKNLRSFRIQGPHYDAIEKNLQETMAVPHKTPTECLEEATRLKDEGNVALGQQNYWGAIKLYEKAFFAIHIICKGRRREIWGDAWFQTQCKGGQYDGQHAQQVRVVLRVKLVANIVLAYIKLQEWDEAHFWGLRTINILRDSMRDAMGMQAEEDTPMLGFAAANEMGKIYYRTGLACREMGDKSEARRLFRVAKMYLPHDAAINKAISSVAIMLG
ncbi:hypothetical protein M501DRAFT_1002764 [Patellaria atrata CBS 101060]|uniref:Uncharacterized protein n=1 Tax=Patellaria atrata CBS 101060 TaxID=1346257 RepID=A0A9P4SDE6_9PEZI|nr:hypothetical protein M501DRAFT_1002764 [Patellaria atrata CBS 101060]